MKREGEKAVMELGIHGLHLDLQAVIMTTLGGYDYSTLGSLATIEIGRASCRERV